MTPRKHHSVYGRSHIHEYVKKLAAWRKSKNPHHTISEEYDRLIVAGVKALYGQDVPMELPEPPVTEQPPAPAVASHG